MNRRQLLELLNRAKSEVSSNTSEAGSSTPSTSVSSLVQVSIENNVGVFLMIMILNFNFQR